jgi:PAS domain S-box-containing protein
LEDKTLKFKTGNMSEKEVKLIFDTLPVDITFVGSNDEVRYFNRFDTRIFKRPLSVIGLKVQNCHPRKSLEKVQQILDEFRAKDREAAEFWINLNDRMIYIRYFPIYDDKDEYIGCLEVSQDITDIQKIEGEKRLL